MRIILVPHRNAGHNGYIYPGGTPGGYIFSTAPVPVVPPGITIHTTHVAAGGETTNVCARK